MSLTTFLQQCLTGISLGGAYALIAIGYTLVYGILRLINFAHGDIFMMAGYFMIFAMASLPWFIAIPVTLIVTVVLGVTIERVAYRPLRSSPRMSVMISAIGVSYLLQNLATYLFTALPKGYPEIPFLKKIYQIGGLSASFVTFLTPVLTLVLVYLLILLINHTKIGMAMRAVSKDYETASLHLCSGFPAGRNRLHPLFHGPHDRIPVLRRAARPQMLCCRCIRRYRKHSRRCHRWFHPWTWRDGPGCHGTVHLQ